VVLPGEALLQLVPSQESLVVEARIRPIDIDDVGPDQSARVRLLAYNYRNVEPLIARIETVSADLVVDQRSGDG
jgi:HlyD family secretion protein